MKRYLISTLCFLLLTPATALAERYAVSAPRANIRSGPDTKHDWVWQVGKFYPIEVKKKEGNWYYFQDSEGDTGWIHNSLIDKTPTVITAKETCNIRTGPGTKNQIAFTVGPGISFQILEKKGNWIHVAHADGDKGWIHKSLVW